MSRRNGCSRCLLRRCFTGSKTEMNRTQSIEQAERVRRAIERNRAETEKNKRDPDGRAAFASGNAITSPAIEEGDFEAVIETPDNTLTLEGEVDTAGRKRGLQGQAATLGKVTMNLKRGGSVNGKLEVNYLNVPLLEGLTKLDENRKNRKFKVSISIEEL